MRSRWRRRLLGLAVVAAGTAALSFWMIHRSDDPHIILISIDTLRRDHVTVYGSRRNTTPNLAALAARGIVFEDAIAAHTNTAPSHASMLTGLTPAQHGIMRNGMHLRGGVATLPELVREVGYTNGAFVSGFSLRGVDTGLDRGFETYDDGEGRSRRAEETGQHAHRWLAEHPHHKGPVFLFFHLFDPHFPYDAPAPFLRTFAPEELKHPMFADLKRVRTVTGPKPGELDEYALRYDAEILYADHWVGELLKLLKQGGYFEHAIIIVTSDHGETLDERPWCLDHGAHVTDEQIRIPLIVRLPGDRYAGTRVRGQIEHADLMPTLLAHLDLQVPPGLYGRVLRFDGSSPAPVRPAFSMGISAPKRILEYDVELSRGVVTGMREPSYKVVAWPAPGGRVVQLFDLVEDPQEKTVLSPPDLATHVALLDAWLKSTGTDLHTEAPVVRADTREGLRALGYVE